MTTTMILGKTLQGPSHRHTRDLNVSTSTRVLWKLQSVHLSARVGYTDNKADRMGQYQISEHGECP